MYWLQTKILNLVHKHSKKAPTYTIGNATTTKKRIFKVKAFYLFCCIGHLQQIYTRTCHQRPFVQVRVSASGLNVSFNNPFLAYHHYKWGGVGPIDFKGVAGFKESIVVLFQWFRVHRLGMVSIYTYTQFRYR